MDDVLWVNDFSTNAAEVKIEGTTTSLYWKRNLKSSINQDINRVQWTIVGDNKRFYLFVGYRQNPKTHAQVLFFGYIQDLVSLEWGHTLLGYKDEQIGNVGYNYAFAYSDWTILPSGHLCCRLTTQPQSDLRWVRTHASSDENLLGYGDVGHHIYPVPVPYVPYTP